MPGESTGGGRRISLVDPTEPAPSSFTFPAASSGDERGKVVVGGDLEPGTVLAAYRAGMFPMRQPSGELAWWSPDPRAILVPADLHVSHSMRSSCRRFEVRVDTAFEAVIDGCAERAPEEYQWITSEIRSAYLELHRLGWAHSVETWTRPEADEPARLVGGLYGVAVGGLFGGESMFHREPDASKVALVGLVERLRGDGSDGAGRLVDVQWLTPHMASLGAIEVSRQDYLARLERALPLPLPPGLMA
jgi:leucyl/phenylalanyl-tRNA--protein transferase